MKKKLTVILLILLVAVFACIAGCSNVEETRVSSVSIFTPPDKTVYVLGEELDLDGAQLQVTYEDDTYKIIDVTTEMVSSFNPSVLGEQLLRVSYQGVGTTVSVKVVNDEVYKVELVTNEAQTYIVEQNLDFSSVELVVTYISGETEKVTVTPSMCSEYDMTITGDQSVKVNFTFNGKEYEVYYDIVVNEKVLTGIEVATKPSKTIYYVGDENLDLTDGVLFLSYDNGYTDYIDMEDLAGLSSSWDSTDVTNTSLVTLNYGGKTTGFYVSIKVKDVLEIEELAAPDNNQLVNTELDLTGLKLKLTYNNYETEVITFPNDNVRITGYNNKVVGNQTLTIYFYAANSVMATSYSMEVFVEERTLENIEIIRPEGDLYQDTFIDITNWEYCLVYNNGDRSATDILADNMIIRESYENVYNYSTAGTKTWVIRYRSFEFDYEFEVLPLKVASVEILAEQPLTVYLGHEIDTTGIYLQVTYNSGAMRYVNGSPIVPLTARMISGFDTNTLGAQTVTINYTDTYTENYPIDLQIVVVKKVVTSLGVYQNPIKTSYLYTEAIDFTGLQISLTYEGDSEATLITVFDEDWTFYNEEWSADHKFSTKGKKNIWITYAGLDNPDTQGVMLTVTVRNTITNFRLLMADLGTVVAGNDLNYSSYLFRLSYEVGSDTITYNSATGEYGIFDEATSAILPLKGTLTFDYNPRNLTTGVRVVDVIYMEGNESQIYSASVTITERGLSGIEVYKLPNKVDYVVAAGGVLDLTGIIVNAVYDNGTRVVLADDEFECSNFEPETLGEQEIRVVYLYNTSITTTFKIEVKTAIAVAIAWSGSVPTVSLLEGVDLNVRTVRLESNPFLIYESVKITMSDGTVTNALVDEISSDLTVKSYEKYSVGTQTAELYYKNSEDMILKLSAKVVARILTSISFDASFDIEVIEMSDIDLSLCSLNLTYNFGMSYDVIPMKQSYIEASEDNLSGYDKTDTTPGIRTVGIYYKGCSTTIQINVLNKTLTSINMNRLPKVKYIEGEYMDAEALSDGSIVLYYNNNTTEEKYLTDATINMSSSLFNINMSRFDNTEFSGQSKLQTIFVTYTTGDNEVFETQFDIIMRDRKYTEVVFENSNVYSFVYGALTEENAPKLSVLGYLSFESTERSLLFDESKIVVEYIRYEDRNEARDPNKDYTLLPTDAGQYVVCVSYNAALYNDMVHNSLNDMSKILTIYKKDIYVGVSNISKTYGTPNPSFFVTAYGTDTSGNLSLTAAPFANGDSFLTAGFRTNNPSVYSSVCYDGEGNLLDIFEIHIATSGGETVDVIDSTGVGSFKIVIGGLTSDNYNITYINGIYEIVKRQVYVQPENVTVVYGTIATIIPYTTSAVSGVANSGLFGTDKLNGNPIKTAGKDAGTYAVTVGSLSNSNYDIIFDKTKIVTIVKRDIYIKTENVTKIYGEELPEFNVSYYLDEACINTNAFAYAADTAEGLGILSFVYADLDKMSAVGIYSVTALYTPYTEYTLPEGLENIYGNYNIHYIAGNLEIDKRVVTVVAAAKTKAFGTADPELTFTASLSSGSDGVGLVVINAALGQYESLSGALSRVAGENVGSYVINSGSLVADNPNYSIVFTSARLTVYAKEIIVRLSAEALTKVYDGRIPSINEFDMYMETDGGEVYIGNQEDVTDNYITVGISSPSRNVGTFNVNVNTIDSNITVAFPTGTTYQYEITPRVVDIEYVDLPADGANEYKKAAYSISAKVQGSQLQKEYNDDGTVKTDNNNNELTDTVQVILSRYYATDVGTYTTNAVRLGNTNYELSEAAKAVVSFRIVPRALVIEVYPTDLATNTLAKEYNGQSVTLNINEYTVHNTIAGDTLQVVPYVYNPNSSSGTSPKDVLYASDGSISSYDIIVDQPSSSNYNVTFLAEYHYKITPRAVTITIFSNFLSKTYDGNAPSINASNYSVSIATLMTSTISFTFTRESSDGRSNADVGNYAISVNCTDKNHTVKLSEDFIYTIERAAVTVTVKSSANSKSYDGASIKYKDNDISMSATPGISPRIRTFANNVLYSAAVENLQAVADSFSDLVSSVYAINFEDMAYSMVLRNVAYSNYTTAKDLFDAYASTYFTTANYNSLNTMLTNVNTVLNDLYTNISNSDATTAANTLARAKAYADQAYNVANKENHYLAFVMSGADANATNVGTYTYTLFSNDLNKDYYLQNVSRVYDITRQSVVLKITGLNENGPEAYYGDVFSQADVTDWETNKLGYEFYADTSFVTKLDNVLITGTLSIVGIVEAGYAATENRANGYAIVPSASITGSANYLVTPNNVYFDIAKKEVTIVASNTVGTVSDVNGALYYGGAVRPIILRQWSLLEGGAELVGTDTVAVFDDTRAKFSCYVENNVEITSASPKVGVYPLTISNFSADNYSFKYVSGSVTINKASLSVLTRNDALSREYGSEVELEFTGFVYGETMAVLGDYIAPQPSDPTAEGFDVLTNANSTYPISFYIPENAVEQFDNYYIHLEESYTINIEPAPLNLVFKGQNNASYLTAVYGSEPIYTMSFVGFVNGETAASLGVDMSSGVSFDLSRTVSESGTYFDAVSFTQDLTNRLSNYSVSTTPVIYNVTPATLTITLARDLTIMYVYDSTTYTGEGRVTMYLVDDNGNVLSGQYYNEDILISGYVNAETAVDVFKFYTVATQYVIDDKGTATVDDDLFAEYLFYTNTIVHSLDYDSSYIGTQPLKVTGLSFVADTPNYTVVSQAVNLTIFSKVAYLSTDGQKVVLEGDEINDMTFNAVTEAVSVETYSFGDTDATIGVSGLNDTIIDQNQNVSITFNKTYTISAYNGPASREIVSSSSGEVETQILANQMESVISNGQVSTTVIFRILQRETKMVTTSYTVNGSAYTQGAKIETTGGGTATVTSTTNANYDVAYLSIRAMRNAVSDSGKITIMFSGTGSSRNVRLVASALSSTTNIYTLETYNGTTLDTSTVLSFGKIDLFDGFTHDVKIYYDKRLGYVYITLDGILAEIATLGSEYNNENSSVLTVYATGNLDVWLTHMYRYKQGYVDNYATLVRPAVNGTDQFNMYYLTNYYSTTTVTLTSLFTPTTLAASTYKKAFSVNGTVVYKVGSAGNVISGNPRYTFSVGVYDVTLQILDGADNVISTGSLNVIVSASPSTSYYVNVAVSPSNPVVVNSFTAESESNIPASITYDHSLISDSDSAIVSNVYALTKASDGVTNYRSLEMTFAYNDAHIVNASNQLDMRSTATFTYLLLSGDAASFASSGSYYPSGSNSVAVQIARTYNGSNVVTYSTNLVIYTGGVRYITSLSGSINWDDGSIYTVGLYLDYLAASSASTWSGRGFTVAISKDGELCARQFINTSVEFDNGSSISISNMNKILSNSTRNAAIRSSDCRITMYDVTFNGGDIGRYDYYRSTGAFIQSNPDDGVTTGANASLTLAAPNGYSALFSIYNTLSLRFKTTTPITSRANAFIWYLATNYDSVISTVPDVASSRGIYLGFDAAEDSLYFSFYNGNLNYYKQIISTSVDLTDGNEHTVTVQIDDTAELRSEAIAGITSGTARNYYVAKAYVYIDGEYGGLGYFPFYNSIYNWIDGTNSYNSGEMTTSESDTFKPLYSFTSVKTASGVSMIVYDYDIGLNASKHYAG